jgi:DNA-binding MarR family transcriptional regulator
MTVAREAEDGMGRADRLLRSAEILDAASRALAGLVPTLQRLAEAERLRDLALGHRAEITDAAIRSILAARRLRDQFLAPPIGDPAWSILLEALAARLGGRRLSMTDLGAAARLPPAIARRWIARLIARGLLARSPARGNERIVLVDLTDETADRLRAYLAAALKISPWVA